jgi:hypothetical protein
MTAKEKANELFCNMQGVRSNSYSEITRHFAKKSAIVAAEEVLKTLYEHHYDSQSGAYEYWQEVKTELEKNIL